MDKNATEIKLKIKRKTMNEGVTYGHMKYTPRYASILKP